MVCVCVCLWYVCDVDVVSVYCMFLMCVLFVHVWYACVRSASVVGCAYLVCVNGVYV